MLPTLAFALVLGFRHAVDADHLAAITSLTTYGTLTTSDVGHGGVLSSHRLFVRSSAQALFTAAIWGLGHAVTIVGVGVPIVLLRSSFPPSFARATELSVAVMLVLLGLRALRGQAAPAASTAGRARWQSFAVGCVHGLGGSAGLTLLAATSLPSRFDAFLFLIVFGLGTVAGMLGATALLIQSLRWLTLRRRSAATRLSQLAGVASVAMGIWIAAKLLLMPTAL